MEACKHGIRTRFLTGCALVNELIEARDEKTLRRIIKRYAGYSLLIIDELGYVPFVSYFSNGIIKNIVIQVLA